MQELLDKRLSLETELRSLEKQIFDLETNYIEETQETGNIVKGWEKFLTNKSTKSVQFNNTYKKIKLNASERIFSLSSCTSPAGKALEDESDRSVLNGMIAPNYKSKRNTKKKNYAKYTELIYNKEPKKDDIFGYDDDGGNDSNDYLRVSAKTPTSAQGKSDKKKLAQKLNKTKSKKTTKL